MSSVHSHSAISQLFFDPQEPHSDDENNGSSPVRAAHDDTNTLQQNSVAFPGEEALEIDKDAPAYVAGGKGSRTLSDLLKLHAEKGTEFTCSPEEASRLADVLGQWINSGSSPYETEDDFFAQGHAQDDTSLPSSKRANAKPDASGRPRGQSESVPRRSS